MAHMVRYAKRAFHRGVKLASEAGAWLLVAGSPYLIGALRREVAEAGIAEKQTNPTSALQKPEYMLFTLVWARFEARPGSAHEAKGGRIS
jgi:hypothetical protein